MPSEKDYSEFALIIKEWCQALNADPYILHSSVVKICAPPWTYEESLREWMRDHPCLNKIKIYFSINDVYVCCIKTINPSLSQWHHKDLGRFKTLEEAQQCGDDFLIKRFPELF